MTPRISTQVVDCRRLLNGERQGAMGPKKGGGNPPEIYKEESGAVWMRRVGREKESRYLDIIIINACLHRSRGIGFRSYFASRPLL